MTEKEKAEQKKAEPAEAVKPGKKAEEEPKKKAASAEKREVAKEEKPAKKELEERIYTVPLRRAWLVSRRKRAPKAVRILRNFMVRHMKAESVVITNEINEALWSRGIQKPPRRIRVKAAKDKEGVVTVYPVEVKGD